MVSSRLWGHAVASSAVALNLASAAHAAADFESETITAINALNQDWYDSSTGLWNALWWNSANALTTLADFVTLDLAEANKLNLGGVIRNTWSKAQNTNVQTTKSIAANGMMSTQDCLNCSSTATSKRRVEARGFKNFINDYYDDEGWWALGLIRSYDATGDSDYLNSAIEIFDDMQTGSGTPCGGIWWDKSHTYVNAIANELYLAVAASLANRVPGNSTYLKIAKDQWTWFYDSGMINGNNLINDGLDSNCKNNGLTTWTYNQGVILGGLLELSLITSDRSYLDMAVKIANAAISALTKNGVLVEADSCELQNGNCGSDGQQFKGIFVRNVRYINAYAPSSTFTNFITTNANSIWSKDKSSDNRLGVAWTGPYVTATGPSHSSALDALVAAVAVSQS